MARVVVKQHDGRDCGPACLSSIGRHYGLKIPLARIRQMAGSDRKGTNLLGMLEAADKMGFLAKGVRAGEEALPQIPLPAVAHVRIQNSRDHHYLVIYRVKKNIVTVMDPAQGRMVKYEMQEFMAMWTGVLVILGLKKDFQPLDLRIDPSRRFLNLVRPHRKVLLQLLFGAIIYTILGLGMAVYIQKITDHVLVNGNNRLLNLLSLIMVLIVSLQAYIGCKKSLYMLKTGQLIDARLVLGYYQHLLQLPQRFFDTMQVGEIISRINDAIKIRAFINNVAVDMLVNILIVLFAVLLMFFYYWKLALVVLLVMPLYILVYTLLNYFNKKVERRFMEKAARLESQFVESISKIKTIKGFGAERAAYEKTENKFVSLLFTTYLSGANNIFATTSTQFLASFFTVVLFWVGSAYVMEGEITTGELFSFYALMGYFTSPVTALIGANKHVQNALIAAERLYEIMGLEQEQQSHSLTTEPGDILFESVCFKYGTRKAVFDGLDLYIRKNKTTAIVGESGCGKTSILSLIQNHYPLSSGRITIGGVDLNYLDKKHLKKLIGVVPQQIDLFSGSVLENIALGDQDPDLQKAMNICHQLGILNFVEELPEGFNTMLGPDGILLSGGERQKIALARALYRDPQILLLDEATSAMDTISENLIREALNRFKSKGKTIVIVTHRLSTITEADTILVLKEGRLMEEGPHEELCNKKGYYYQLWQKPALWQSTC